ncbi:MAG TPA: hypothetical protein VFT82_03090 [Candidatus Paceibacterota bacterium]|nr:hypothetical protein [Candidatus Paceibacterota bacterium]
MNHYTYKDHSKHPAPPATAFECDAENILEADKLYTASTGQMPEKQPWIQCSIVFAKAASE